MGNCIDHHQKAATWVDDDDESGSAESAMHHYSRKEKAREVGAAEGLLGAGVAPSATEVKVKISKKQLEELLQRVEGKGLPIQQVLTDLLSMGDQVALRGHEQHWRPSLQSIPEFPE